MASSKGFIYALAFVIAGNVSADFKIDLDARAVNERLEVYTLGDLGIGDTGFVSTGYICQEDEYVMLPKELVLENDRSEYGTYFKVKRLPDDKISLEIIPSKSTSKKDGIISFVKSLANNRSTLNCKVFRSIFGLSTNELLSVSSVEGADSVKSLLISLNL